MAYALQIKINKQTNRFNMKFVDESNVEMNLLAATKP